MSNTLTVIKLTREMNQTHANIIEIGTDLAALQEHVGGYIEMMQIELNGTSYDLIFNEEGKLVDLPFTLGLVHQNQVFDIVAGNIIIAKSTEEGETIGLTKEDIQSLESFMKENPLVVNYNKEIIPCFTI